MRLSNLLPLAAAIPMVSAYANLALRFDALMKRDNSTIAAASTDLSASSSAVTTAIGTTIATTDAYGQPTTIYTTTTIVYYTTLPVSSTADEGYTPTESVSTYADPTTNAESTAEDSTITSLILTTITIDDGSSTSVGTVGTTTETLSGSSETLTIASGLNYNADAEYASSTAAAESSSPATVTVTVTATPDDCYGTSMSTGVMKVAVTASFTFTASNGELFTAATTTEVEQTTTEVVYLTSTLTPTVTSSTGANDTYVTTTYESTTTDPSSSAYYANGTNSGSLKVRALDEEYGVSEFTARELFKRFFGLF